MGALHEATWKADLAQRNKNLPAAQDAIAWLGQVSQQIPVNGRTRPEGFMNDETFRSTCLEKI